MSNGIIPRGQHEGLDKLNEDGSSCQLWQVIIIHWGNYTLLVKCHVSDKWHWYILNFLTIPIFISSFLLPCAPLLSNDTLPHRHKALLAKCVATNVCMVLDLSLANKS